MCIYICLWIPGGPWIGFAIFKVEVLKCWNVEMLPQCAFVLQTKNHIFRISTFQDFQHFGILTFQHWDLFNISTLRIPNKPHWFFRMCRFFWISWFSPNPILLFNLYGHVYLSRLGFYLGLATSKPGLFK